MYEICMQQHFIRFSNIAKFLISVDDVPIVKEVAFLRNIYIYIYKK
jgi:hypothetical protein